MRQFASKTFQLRNLSFGAKLVYSFFCILSLFGIISSILLYEDLVGPVWKKGHGQQVQNYYGQETKESTPIFRVNQSSLAAIASSSPSSSLPVQGAAPQEMGHQSLVAKTGPMVELPNEEEALPKMTLQIPYRKLLEVTHFHLFTIPVFLLILTHLFLLTGISAFQKHSWILLGWLMGSLHLFAPWLIRVLGTKGIWLFPVSGVGFTISSLVLLIVSLFSMWKRPLEDKSKSS